MNIETKEIAAKTKEIVLELRKHVVPAIIVISVMLLGFLIFRIGAIIANEPPEGLVTERLTESRRLVIDQEAIDKIQQLQDQNVRVKSLFKSARNNPFQE